MNRRTSIGLLAGIATTFVASALGASSLAPEPRAARATSRRVRPRCMDCGTTESTMFYAVANPQRDGSYEWLSRCLGCVRARAEADAADRRCATCGTTESVSWSCGEATRCEGCRNAEWQALVAAMSCDVCGQKPIVVFLDGTPFCAGHNPRPHSFRGPPPGDASLS